MSKLIDQIKKHKEKIIFVGAVGAAGLIGYVVGNETCRRKAIDITSEMIKGIGVSSVDSHPEEGLRITLFNNCRTEDVLASIKLDKDQTDYLVSTLNEHWLTNK